MRGPGQFFRVISNHEPRQRLIKTLRLQPASREIFDDYLNVYKRGGMSFSLIADPVERAAALFYQSNYAYGGKLRFGGFCVSENRRIDIKQVGRWRNRLRALAWFGQFFSSTVIENQDYSEIISRYGRSSTTVLYCDPPYVGTEKYYSVAFSEADHTFLAHQLQSIAAAAVVSYYDCDLIKDLYPESLWTRKYIESTKGRNRSSEGPQRTRELVLIKPAARETGAAK